jgi:hypothetical protein
MAKLSQGILGGISGKVGTVVGGSWKGIDYIRSKPAQVSNPRTEGQVAQRNKFTATLEFLQPLNPFLRIGYKNYTNKKSAFNAAMSYILKNAITGTAPNFSVDYQNAMVSRGSLTGALNPNGASTNVAEIDFSWTDNSGSGNAVATDKAMLVAFNPTDKSATYVTAGADRSTGNATLQVPSTFSGDNVEVYIAFISADGVAVSDSIYVGQITVA